VRSLLRATGELGERLVKLIKLSCDRPSFRTLEFNPEGLTLILGDGPTDISLEGSSNGVGKTLALCLVHHCLGAKTDPRLKAVVPDWKFSLEFELAGRKHIIERLGNGRGVAIDHTRYSQLALRHWLDRAGVFTFDEGVPGLTFRALIKRFARYKREDCVDPLRMNQEPDFDAEIRSLYLLGLDCSLAVLKQATKFELDAIKQTGEIWKSDNVLRDMLRSGAAPRLRAEWLDREIPRLREELQRFQVSENYREIQNNASDLTSRLREIELRQSVLEFKRSSIQQSLVEHPDITRDDLLKLYGGLEQIFRSETLAHFEAVEEFHGSLTANRRNRLGQDLAVVLGELSEVETVRASLATARDAQLEALQGKRALDEYAAMASRLAALDEERKRIGSYLDFTMNLQERAQQQRESRVEQDRAAAAYIALEPAAQDDMYFKSLAEIMYPSAPAGILLENNTGDNQIRYNLSVEIEGDDSDGINSARILCFDWLLLMRGARHTVDFLWHDNRLFADIDPGSRAAWFSHTASILNGTGKQYIASVNTENFDGMGPYLEQESKSALQEAIRLTLKGDRPEHKLLGVQFG
jgi:uncharacterized protein YydD (DUF2326 family)